MVNHLRWTARFRLSTLRSMEDGAKDVLEYLFSLYSQLKYNVCLVSASKQRLDFSLTCNP